MLDLPSMLILDEATSSIDTRTEQKIQNAFAENDGRTNKLYRSTSFIYDSECGCDSGHARRAYYRAGKSRDVVKAEWILCEAV